jgi:hypothetical protein
MASEPTKVGTVERYTSVNGPAWRLFVGPSESPACWAWGLSERVAMTLSAELARGREAVEVLRSVEWESGELATCPVCDRWEKDGHSPDCRLAKVIGGIRE